MVLVVKLLLGLWKLFLIHSPVLYYINHLQHVTSVKWDKALLCRLEVLFCLMNV